MSMPHLTLTRRLCCLNRDREGSIFVEAALVLPLTVLVLAGIAEWGVTLYQYNMLSTATGAAVRQLIINRGFPNPYTNALGEFDTWAGNLNLDSGQVTISIQNSSNVFKDCSSDNTCMAMLDDAQGKSARVTANFPCQMQFTPQIASPCPIEVTATGLVE